MQENPRATSLNTTAADEAHVALEHLQHHVTLHWASTQQDNPQRDGVCAFFLTLDEQPAVYPIVKRILHCSPYLSGLLHRYPESLYALYTRGVDAALASLLAQMDQGEPHASADALMQHLRTLKSKAALMIAVADISKLWTMERCTLALSDLADHALKACMRFLLRQAHDQGQLVLPHPEEPMKDCGVFIIGMGKLGSQTLNYSSDVDLIVLFEAEQMHYLGRHSLQHCMTRMAQDLMRLMQERTKDGYVFRTDLRLRPDPASTPPAMTVGAAITYYETVGQNWERAAMIKGRIVAGDEDAGERFLKAISPFMWRRHLDFASIDDILSIKRQMHRGSSSDIQIAGHNIKTGYGGIREIEFYGQIHQLIWGGKKPELRLRGTLETLRRLETLDMVDSAVVRALSDAYRYLRTVEHRLQMMRDEQTQTIPEDPEELNKLAIFMGHSTVADFSRELDHQLKLTHAHYMAAFHESEPLDSSGNLVFTGVDVDEQTLATLRGMGYTQPEKVSLCVMDWHKGNRRCTKTHRSRELLTELVPTVLRALGATANPDDAFMRFDEFMGKLPAGVQIFSLFQSNPELLNLIAEILGSAPSLGLALSHDPHLLDAALLGDFYAQLPAITTLSRQLDEMLLYARDDEDKLMMLHRFRKEKMFQAGVQLLKMMISAEEAGTFLSDLADCLLEKAITMVIENFETQYGYIEGGSLGIIALGKLGTREMTFESDIDLVFVYRCPENAHASTGERSLMPQVYYNRLAQRILGTITAASRNGRLYEVDTRLRPFGNDGALAVTLQALDKYYTESAWIFEKLALTRGRCLFATDGFAREVKQLIAHHQRTAPAPEAIAQAIHAMREKVTAQFGGDDPWNIKYAHGGLMDTDFIVQYWILSHADSVQDIPAATVPETLKHLRDSGKVHVGYVSDVMLTRHLLTTLLFYLRLCSDGSLDESRAPEGLKKILVEATQMPSFEALRARLLESERNIHEILLELGNT